MNRRNNILCVALVLCAQAMYVQAGVAEVQQKIEALRAPACANIFTAYFEAWREIYMLALGEQARSGCIKVLTEVFKERLQSSNEDEAVVDLWTREEDPELLAFWVQLAKKADMPANYYDRKAADPMEPAAFAFVEPGLGAENPVAVPAPAPVPAPPVTLPVPAAAVPKLTWYRNSYLKYGAYFVVISGVTYTMYRYYKSRKQVSPEKDAEPNEINAASAA